MNSLFYDITTNTYGKEVPIVRENTLGFQLVSRASQPWTPPVIYNDVEVGK